MTYVIIGDLHGRVEIMEKVLKDYPEHHKVFIGDYVDSFDRSRDDQLTIVRTLLKSAQERDDVTALIGNHELSYIRTGMQCSGHRSKTNFSMNLLKQDILKFFKRHLWLDEVTLVTHAGASQHLFADTDELKSALDNDAPELYNIGRFRGGRDSVGGIFWCDFWGEFTPIEGLTQIVGHSSHRPQGEPKGVVQMMDAFNIDCLDRVNEALVVNTDDPKKTTFEIIDI